jgi:hypothetical protein
MTTPSRTRLGSSSLTKVEELYLGFFPILDPPESISSSCIPVYIHMVCIRRVSISQKEKNMPHLKKGHVTVLVRHTYRNYSYKTTHAIRATIGLYIHVTLFNGTIMHPLTNGYGKISIFGTRGWTMLTVRPNFFSRMS